MRSDAIYRIWDHFFTKEELLSEVYPTGFGDATLYGDVAGKAFSDTGKTICGVFIKDVYKRQPENTPPGYPPVRPPLI